VEAAVRPARLDDLPAVAAIDAACFEGHAYPSFFFRQALDALDGFFLVAEVEGAVVGYALGVLAAGSTEGWILSMAVLPAARGRGLGARLVEDILGRLRARGAHEVRLTVDPANRAALSLYERHGFRLLSEDPSYFGPKAHRLVLSRIVAG
jgi:ribosomal protein S18 acetylase RimI-like enzyme